MSFASEIREELVRISLPAEEQKARLCGFIQLSASISISSNGLSLLIKNSNGTVLKEIGQDIANLYDVKCKVQVVKQANLSKGNIYSLIVDTKAQEILHDLDLWTERGLTDHPRLAFLNNEGMIRCYLAGCFISGGSVNSPRTTNYHLEFRTENESHGQFIIKLLEKFNIESKLSSRRDHFIVYVKKGEKVGDILRLIGASKGLMEFEDVRIQRDFVNNLSRLDNVKIANEQKIQEVADRQYMAVDYLIKKDVLKLLSVKDQQIALLRYENPEASLLELSDLYQQMTSNELSKSGVKHRFEKIFDLYEKYKEREKENEE